MFANLKAYLRPRRHSFALVEYDAQVCEIDHRYGESAILCITDCNVRGRRSVTNGIEAVLSHQVIHGNLKPGMFVIYRDSEMVWDQVLIDEFCHFVNFRSLHEPDQADAMTHVLMMEFSHER